MTSRPIFDLYGSKTLSLDETQDAVGRVLGIDFRRRNSLHMGGDYFSADGVGQLEFTLYQNRDEEGEVIEDEFDDYPVILEIAQADQPDEYRKLLSEVPGLEFLQRTIL